MKTYGYARVSTTDQKLDRQLDEFEKLNVDKVYSDKLSGKDFQRPEYQKLRKKLKAGDLLIISSIDRLGRDYEMITEEWRYLTKELEVDIFVIDMPILDTRTTDSNLMGKLISDIVLQLLSYVAQTEREKTKQRQRAGIEAARKRGIHMGRPKYELPKNFEKVSKDFNDKIITMEQVLGLTGMAKSTFLKYHRKTYPAKKRVFKEKVEPVKSERDIRFDKFKQNELHYIKRLIEKETTLTKLTKELQLTFDTIRKEVNKNEMYQKSLKFDNLIKENRKLLSECGDKIEARELRQRIKLLEVKNIEYKQELLKGIE